MTRRESRLVSAFFLTTIFCSTFEKVHWGAGGTVYLADLTTLAFLAAWAIDRLPRRGHRMPRTAAVLVGFMAAFLLVYLIGFYNLGTSQALDQFGKGIAKWLIHFTFLIVAVTYLASRTSRYFWRTLTFYFAGMTFNALYGLLQLVAARAGHNLDALFVKPLTRGASQINVYGAVNGTNVYRPNALTGDPNHLAIMLLIPLLVLSPIYLRLERGHPKKTKLAVLIAVLLGVELTTLSRSGLLGLAVGALVLLVPYRRMLWSWAAALPLVLVAIPIVFELYRRQHFFSTVIKSRLSTSGKGTEAHFGVYDFIPQVMHMHPLFGLGYNNFSVYYELVTGKTNWGPHSYYVMLLVEGGIAGGVVFAAFLVYLLHRLGVARGVGRALAAAGRPEAARVRPLAWGMTAAFVGTLAANAFYLTLPLFYFFVFLALVLAAPIVFGRGFAPVSVAARRRLVPTPA
jgi:O-antigen ligase/polysaccharide polymerase Wzy-like membrane protein